MIQVRSLPPFLLVALVIGILFILTSIALAVWIEVTLLQGHMYVAGAFPRTIAIASSLLALGLAFGLQAGVYQARVRSPGTAARLPGTWQRQARTIALQSVLPICALTLALFVSFSPLGYVFPQMLIVVAVIVNLAISIRTRYRPENPTEPHFF